LAFLAAPQLLDASTFNVKSGAATFTAVGKPGFIRINGEGPIPAGKFEIDEKTGIKGGEIQIKLDQLTTGLSLRDSHMKEKYLETAKFPTAVFTVQEAKFPDGKIPELFDLPGILNLHGKQLPVTASVHGKVNSGSASGEADFEIVLSDFGIEIPQFSGITVANSVKVHIRLEAIQ
jgi:polyisoprenoid-binding protein YceI